MPGWWQMTLDWLGMESPPAQESARDPQPKSQGFSHPESNRTLDLAGVPVAYRFVRCKRRSIGFVIHPEGLVVRAPQWVSIAQVEAALRERSAWILTKLRETQERQAQVLAQQPAWADGSVFPLQGQLITLRCGPQGEGLASAWPAWPGVLEAGELVLPAKWQRKGQAPSQEALRMAVLGWVRSEAHGYFVSRLDHFAPQLAVRWTQLGLSQARTRWGSARQDGAIRLNWRLMHLAPDLIDYVVVHELSHLRVMNHSPQFWRTVAGVLPDVQNLRRRLRESTVP